jgi:hypothetical protein
MKILGLAALAITIATPAFAQTLDGGSLTWLAGSRVHTNANGSKVYEAFIGPINGVMTGTALSAIGKDQAYTEYHKLGPNAEGKWGLSVANTRSNMVWNFTPLKVIDKDKVVFQTTDGNLTITYFSKPGGSVGSTVERKGADGQTTKTDYDFKPVAGPAMGIGDPLGLLRKTDSAPAPTPPKHKGF